MEKIQIINQIHRACPQTLTKENLARWITEQQKQVINHTTKVPLTPEEVSELEHKSSLASRALDRLKQVEDEFKLRLKKGTNIDPNNPTEYLPYDIIIPPTSGTDALKANRQFADELVEKGYNEDITEVYMIPFPEEMMMVAMTIEGYETPKYTRKMTPDEDALYGKLFVQENGELNKLDNKDIDVSSNGTARIRTSKGQKKPFI